MIYKRHHSIETSQQDYEKYFGSLSGAKRQCFNVGAGTWQHEAWTNIDLPAQSEEFAKIQAPCIHHNLVENDDLPIAPESADLIYTSHVIEHLPDINANKLFFSVYKSLKDGGVFRVVTGPDADTDVAALLRKDSNWWYFYEDADYANAIREHGPMSLTDKWLLHVASPRSHYSSTPCERKYSADEVDAMLHRYRSDPAQVRDVLTQGLGFNVRHPGDHLTWWNADKLIRQLHTAGFSLAEKSAYGQSRASFMRDLRWFDTTYPQISLYVEAVK